MKGSLMIRMENFSLLRTDLLKRYFDFFFLSAHLHTFQILDHTISSSFCTGKPHSGLDG